MIDQPECPDCGEPMTERTNRSTGESFWGCPDYPKCRGTRPLDADPSRDQDTRLPSERLARGRSRRWE